MNKDPVAKEVSWLGVLMLITAIYMFGPVVSWVTVNRTAGIWHASFIAWSMVYLIALLNCVRHLIKYNEPTRQGTQAIADWIGGYINE